MKVMQSLCEMLKKRYTANLFSGSINTPETRDVLVGTSRAHQRALWRMGCVLYASCAAQEE